MSELEKLNKAIKQCSSELYSLFEGNRYCDDLGSVSSPPKWDKSLLEVLSESELISRYKILKSSLSRFRTRRDLALENQYMDKLLER